MYFIDPVQLHGLISKFSPSSSERQMRHIYERSLIDDRDVFFLLSFWLFLVRLSISLWVVSYSSKGLLSNPAIVSPLSILRVSITSTISFSRVVTTPSMVLLLAPYNESLMASCFISLGSTNSVFT